MVSAAQADVRPEFLGIGDPRIRVARMAVPEGPIAIYALCDPRDGTVRYVGKTVDEAFRLAMHLKAKQRNFRLTAWIKDLKGSQLEPIMWPLQHVSALAWEEVERHWIAWFRRHASLYNIEDGGVPGYRKAGNKVPPLPRRVPGGKPSTFRPEAERLARRERKKRRRWAKKNAPHSLGEKLLMAAGRQMAALTGRANIPRRATGGAGRSATGQTANGRRARGAGRVRDASVSHRPAGDVGPRERVLPELDNEAHGPPKPLGPVR